MIRNCVRIRRLSEKGLYPTKESYLHSSVNRSRHEQVEKAVSSKVRIYKEGAHPSFITDEFFGRWERGSYVPRFRFPKTKNTRLKWFGPYPSGMYDHVNPDDLENLDNSKRHEIESIQNISSRYLAHVGNMANHDLEKALTLANHWASLEIVHNFSNLDISDGKLISLCLEEDFVGENALHFNTIIEDFDENIVLNGSKMAVRGAIEADYFLVFSATIVKDRDDELYKRQTVLCIPAGEDGISIEPQDDGLFRVNFEDVEISPEMLIGKIGFGKIYGEHLRNIGNLLLANIAKTILDKNLTVFNEDSVHFTRNGVTWTNHDSSRALVADAQVALWSLEAMIRLTNQRRGFIFDDLESEINAIKVFASSKILDIIQRIAEFYPYERSGLSGDIEILNQISISFGTKKEALANIGFKGVNSCYNKTAEVLSSRRGTSWNNVASLFSSQYFYKKAQWKYYFNKDPKILQAGKTGKALFGANFFVYENMVSNPARQMQIYWDGMADHFVHLFDNNSKQICDRLMRMIELHGGDINTDEHILSKVGQLGVDHFALGSLYSYLKQSGKLDENADFLVREILRLEAESLSSTEPKFQMNVDVEPIIPLEVKEVPKILEASRKYTTASPLAIENSYRENEKFLSHVENLKLLDDVPS